MVCSRSPRPSAANRLSSGMVYPRVFFQLLMQAGMFHWSRSSLVSFRGGACRTGTGSSAGPRGAFLCWCFGGIIGSTWAGTIWITRCAAEGLYPGASGRGVYLINCVFFSISLEVFALAMADPDGLLRAVLSASSFCRASWVRFAVSASSWALGRARSSVFASPPRRSSYREYTVLPEFVPPLTIASYEISPFLSTSTLTMARDVLGPRDCACAFFFFRWGLPMWRGYCAT
mmetsp:Transcript_29924/g.70530  ORF Transcript_29924/g.70530 Transcript_29924/m.70530 type:complete len:231 (+) Transcript_29924:225-917(+)